MKNYQYLIKISNHILYLRLIFNLINNLNHIFLKETIIFLVRWNYGKRGNVMNNLYNDIYYQLGLNSNKM